MLYQLSEITSFRQKSDNDFNVAIKLVEQNAVTETKFVNWVNQSIIQTIQNILNSLQKSIHISASLGCSYQTNSHCEKKILEQSCGVVKNAPVNFLNVNLQHIKTFCPSEISTFREKHAKYFSRFQSTIQETTFDLRNLSAEDFKAKANFKLRNEIYPQVEEIKNHLKGNLIIDAAISAAATGINLAIAISSGGSLSVASVLAFLASGAALPIGKHIKEYYDSKKMPEFIWAQLLR